MRNMSFSLTTPQILDQTKDVTRRLGWQHLKEGELVQPVKKCMGLRPGEKIEKIGSPLRVVSVRRERLDAMTADVEYGFNEAMREGFAYPHPYSYPSEFVRFFCGSHRGCTPETVVTRIEFEYMEAAC